MNSTTPLSRIALGFAVAALLSVILLSLVSGNFGRRPTSILVIDFASCKNAGYPIAQSMPEICRAPNGRVFVNVAQSPETVTQQPPPIVVTAPAEGAYVADPTMIKGYARGTWYFEASFPVEIEDGNDTVIARGPAQAQSDWMTEEYVPFSVSLAWSGTPKTDSGVIILKKDNPSGDPERDEQISLPVSFAKTAGTLRINVFFPNQMEGSSSDCRVVFPVVREIPATTSVATAAIKELLKGPTTEEKAQGFSTLIPDGTVLHRITLASGIATADFSPALTQGMAGSCRVSAIHAQIEETLRQFPAIKQSAISVEGRTEDILQP